MVGIFRRRRLPHWDVLDGTYFVTACLAGSIPARGLSALEVFRQGLDARPRPAETTEPDWEHRKHKLLFGELDRWLDSEPAVRHLEQPDVANAVRRAVYHFAGVRYHLMAYAIMPSHLHWVFRPLPAWCASLESTRGAGWKPASPSAGWKPAPRGRRTPREVVMHSLKSFTGNECNRLLGRQGTFWQDESYDHWVRDDDELARIIEYVENNPVKAGLCRSAGEYVYSSAYDRARWGILPGHPLILPQEPG